MTKLLVAEILFSKLRQRVGGIFKTEPYVYFSSFTWRIAYVKMDSGEWLFGVDGFYLASIDFNFDITFSRFTIDSVQIWCMVPVFALWPLIVVSSMATLSNPNVLGFEWWVLLRKSLSL